jgi:hypothetical protein
VYSLIFSTLPGSGRSGAQEPESPVLSVAGAGVAGGGSWAGSPAVARIKAASRAWIRGAFTWDLLWKGSYDIGFPGNGTRILTVLT